MKKHKIFILSIFVLIIIIILYFVVYIPFKEQKDEKDSIECDLSLADYMMKHNEFKSALSFIELAESTECKYHNYKYEIENAYNKLDRLRKLYGSIDDSTMNSIANKYNLKKDYNDFQKITWYTDGPRLYFGIMKNGKATKLHMTLWISTSIEVKYVKISTDENVYTKDYIFKKLRKYDNETDVELSNDDMKMLDDIFSSVGTVKIRYYGRGGSWDYEEGNLRLPKNVYDAYHELIENLW